MEKCRNISGKYKDGIFLENYFRTYVKIFGIEFPPTPLSFLSSQI